MYNFTGFCPKKGQKLSLTGYGVMRRETLRSSINIRSFSGQESNAIFVGKIFFSTYQYYNKCTLTD